MSFDREEIFQFIQTKNWVKLIELFKNNSTYEAIESDPVASKVVSENFISELITGNSFKKDSAYTFYLSQFHILHKGTNFRFSLSIGDFEKLIVKLASQYLEKGDKQNAFNYAQELPDNAVCKKIIVDFEKSKPKVVDHSQNHEISVTENKEVAEKDLSISLFKSNQEYLFFLAVRNAFQSYMVFPNVSLSALISWEEIKDELSSEEKSYFFKALIDCVVIDQENSYRPIKFIELDSIYHDNQRQQKKDSMKDNIVGKAGHKLYRIRPNRKLDSDREFLKLIREVIQ